MEGQVALTTLCAGAFYMHFLESSPTLSVDLTIPVALTVLETKAKIDEQKIMPVINSIKRSTNFN